MFDFSGKAIEEALPSMPVEVLGLEEVPEVGRYIGEDASIKEKADVLNLLERLKQDKTKRLNLVVKADKAGSLEAVEAGLQKFNDSGEEHIKIVFSGTGDINDSDIKLGASSSAIVLGFNVEPVVSAKKLAETEQVLVRTYTIIYELLEEIEDVVESMLKVGAIEEVFGTAQIIAEFPYGKNERIAGCKVLDGQITKGPKIKVVRGEEVVGETKLKSLKKVREEVVRVETGDECGMMFDPQVEFAVGDVLQSFRTL
ncbi:MAG: translation initiation factor IF-2 [uncultured bacterium]|nr:MAG: translation initiation factor IF-2 [uncultured bacterium]